MRVGAGVHVPALTIETMHVLGPAAAESLIAVWPANDGFVLHGYRAGGYGWITIPGFATFRFSADGPVVASPEDADEASIRDAWLRSILPLVLQARGTQVLHASAVEARGGVIALCGRSTAGKSTLAAALRGRGYELVADDALPFELSNSELRVLPVPFRLRLRQPSSETLQPDEIDAGPARKPMPLRSIVILQPEGVSQPPRRLTPAGAFGALMSHAYCFSLDEGKEELIHAYGCLAASVPVHELRYAQGPAALNSTLDSLEELARA